MEIASGFLATGRSSVFDIRRHPKGSELDNGSIGDSLLIDDLLDFSNEEIGAPIDVYHTGGSLAAPSEETESSNSLASGKCAPEALEVTGLGDISVPCDDLAELEWLSNFVEESFSSVDATSVFSSGLNASNGEHNPFSGERQFGTSSPVSVLESTSMCSSARTDSFNAETHVPGRARSKRLRNGVCFWNTFILSGTDTSASLLDLSSTSTITTTTAHLSADVDTSAYEQGGVDYCSLTKRPKSNQSKARKGQDTVQARGCLHCGIQRTPQWRAGPMGSKTLCNACGVRYKSGRLLPEYRPAASPTFVEAIHSNSHRKVLELRRRKEFGCSGQHQQQQEERNVCGEWAKKVVVMGG